MGIVQRLVPDGLWDLFQRVVPEAPVLVPVYAHLDPASNGALLARSSPTSRSTRTMAGALSLGSCEHSGPCIADLGRRLAGSLVGFGSSHRGSRCSPLYLVRLWCSVVVSARPYSSERWVGLLMLYGDNATKGGGSEEVPEPHRSGTS
jgi:hypothetical protein